MRPACRPDGGNRTRKIEFSRFFKHLWSAIFSPKKTCPKFNIHPLDSFQSNTPDRTVEKIRQTG
jgi:hypothetical protein